MTFEGDIVTPDELQSAGDLIDEYMVLISKPDSGQLFNMTVQDFKEALSIQGSEGWKTATLSSFFFGILHWSIPSISKIRKQGSYKRHYQALFHYRRRKHKYNRNFHAAGRFQTFINPCSIMPRIR